MSVGRTGDGSPEGELVLRDDRRLALDVHVRPEQYRRVDVDVSLGGLEPSLTLEVTVRSVADPLGDSAPVVDVRDLKGVRSDRDQVVRGHESSPLRSGPEVAPSEVPAKTVAETTDTDLRGAGEGAGAAPQPVPALTPTYLWQISRDSGVTGYTVEATEETILALAEGRWPE